MLVHRLPALHHRALAFALLGVLGFSSVAESAAEGPFHPFVGTWRGNGEVVGSNGTHERIRCRANYSDSREGEALTQTIICASPSYKMDIQSHVEASGESVQGDWSESTRNISGHLTGRIVGGRFEGAVQGQGFTAGISLVSNGRSQAVNIAPSRGDIANVSIELTRGG